MEGEREEGGSGGQESKLRKGRRRRRTTYRGCELDLKVRRCSSPILFQDSGLNLNMVHYSMCSFRPRTKRLKNI